MHFGHPRSRKNVDIPNEHRRSSVVTLELLYVVHSKTYYSGGFQCMWRRFPPRSSSKKYRKEKTKRHTGFSHRYLASLKNRDALRGRRSLKSWTDHGKKKKSPKMNKSGTGSFSVRTMPPNVHTLVTAKHKYASDSYVYI